MDCYKIWVRNEDMTANVVFCGLGTSPREMVGAALVVSEQLGVDNPIIDQVINQGKVMFGKCPHCDRRRFKGHKPADCWLCHETILRHGPTCLCKREPEFARSIAEG